ncbi:MAG: nitroreductase [Desulfatiglandales bacterium]
MEFFECLGQRRSYRVFFQKDVDKGVMEKVLKAANRSPSYKNTQPWEVFVVAGEKRDALAKKLFDQASSGTTPTPDFPFPKEWPEALAQRSEEHGLRRAKATGIDPEDKEELRKRYLKNFQFYDAPCAVLIGMDRNLTPWSVFDLGLFVHGLLLSLEAEGLGACPQAMPMAYPEIIRKELGIPDTICFILAIAVGYPDLESPVNQYHSYRKDTGEFVRWYGF